MSNFIYKVGKAVVATVVGVIVCEGVVIAGNAALHDVQTLVGILPKPVAPTRKVR